eukprot:5701737-Pyramimonas_sp.AAC.1
MHAVLFSHALITARAHKEAPSMKHPGRSSMGRLAGATTVGCQSEAAVEPQWLRRRQKEKESKGTRLTAACIGKRVSRVGAWRY